jgi:hypothetical protein
MAMFTGNDAVLPFPLRASLNRVDALMTDKRGVSALLLQRQLGLSRYETSWMMLHKLRRAMVNTTREPLHGEGADNSRTAEPLLSWSLSKSVGKLPVESG